MGKRKLPYGYAMENGDIKAAPNESDSVIWIFRAYNAGASLRKIASELNTRTRVQYDTDKPWNKSMLDRILQDQRYTGDALYPEIVPEALYRAVQCRRTERRGVPKQTAAQKMIRILGGRKPEETFVTNILAAMNHLIRNQEAIQAPDSKPPDHTRHYRIQRELEAVMNRQPIDEDRAAELIRGIAEAEYNMIGNDEYETERLRLIFRQAELTEELSAELLRKTVVCISVEAKSVSITLKNNQTIEVSD